MSPFVRLLRETNHVKVTTPQPAPTHPPRFVLFGSASGDGADVAWRGGIIFDVGDSDPPDGADVIHVTGR